MAIKKLGNKICKYVAACGMIIMYLKAILLLSICFGMAGYAYFNIPDFSISMPAYYFMLTWGLIYLDGMIAMFLISNLYKIYKVCKW